jgi:hypothetical protein
MTDFKMIHVAEVCKVLIVNKAFRLFARCTYSFLLFLFVRRVSKGSLWKRKEVTMSFSWEL